MLKIGSKSQLIVRVPGIHGGEPVIRGTRVPVRSIVIASQEYAGDIARIARAFTVDVEAVRAALAYYERNKAEVDEIIEKRERDATFLS